VFTIGQDTKNKMPQAMAEGCPLSPPSHSEGGSGERRELAIAGYGACRVRIINGDSTEKA